MLRPRLALQVGGVDLTDLVDMDEVVRTLGERGEISLIFSLPVRSTNEVPANVLTRDTAVMFVVDGTVRWYGHVVNVRPTGPYALMVECAGSWDTLHNRQDYQKGFLYTGYDFEQASSRDLGDGIHFQRVGTFTYDTTGQLLVEVANGAVVKDNHGIYLLLRPTQGLEPYSRIKRVVFDVNADWANHDVAVFLCNDYGLQNAYYYDYFGSVGPPESVYTSWPNYYSSEKIDYTVSGSFTTLGVRVNCTGATTMTSAFAWQLRNLKVYIDRTTAPTIDVAAGDIYTDVTNDTNTKLTTIGSAVTSLMCDGLKTPADHIQDVLALATVPPICGVMHNTFHCKPRPSSPASNTELWVVSDQLTDGLEWDVTVDDAQAKDYICVTYGRESTNLIADPYTNGSSWPSNWTRSDTQMTVYSPNWYRCYSASPYFNPSGESEAIDTYAGLVLKMRFSYYLGAYTDGRAQVGIVHHDASHTVLRRDLWVDRTSATPSTETSYNESCVVPTSTDHSHVFIRWTGRGSTGTTSIYVRGIHVEWGTPDGLLSKAWYPSLPPDWSQRSLLVESGLDLSETEALALGEQAYGYYHSMAAGRIVVPYEAMNGLGQRVSVEHIEPWHWIKNAGKSDPREAGPFLISEVSLQGGVADLTIGTQAGYAYVPATYIPDRGRYVPAHRKRVKYRKRVKFEVYWRKKYGKKKPLPKKHPKYGYVTAYRWVKVAAGYKGGNIE